MSKYGYNENEHVKTIAEAVDKDGFHKVVEINNDEEGSSDTSAKEPIEFYIGDPDDGIASVAIIVNELYANEAGMNTTIILSSERRKIKYYFGDEEPTYENMEEAPNDLFEMWYHSDFIDEDLAPVIYHKIIFQFDANIPASDTTYATVIFYDISGETPVEWGRKTSRWT